MPRLAALTKAGLQFNEAPDKTVEVNGVLRISVSTDNGLQDVGVELETWWRKKEKRGHRILYPSYLGFVSEGG